MIKDRNQVIVQSQFNIHGSRGKSVKPFITRTMYHGTLLVFASLAMLLSPTGFVEQGEQGSFAA